MATATTSGVLQWIQQALGIQSAAEKPPVEVAKIIQPVLEVSPCKITEIQSAISTTSATNNLLQVATNKDFYLVFANLAYTKDAASDMNDCFINIKWNGADRRVIRLVSQTLTVATGNAQHTAPQGIKVDRGSIISLQGSFTVGTCSKVAVIGGYYVE